MVSLPFRFIQYVFFRFSSSKFGVSLEDFKPVKIRPQSLSAVSSQLSAFENRVTDG